MEKANQPFGRTMAIAALAGLLALGGCAAHGPVDSRNGNALPHTAVKPNQHPGPPETYLTLSQIQPVPTLGPAGKQAAPHPSLEAIQLYARARAALDDDNRAAAIRLLERAIKADPESVELYTELAHVYLANAAYNDASLSALETAIAVDPDNLELQYEAGRQYVAKGDPTSAMLHLRLAMQTTAYKSESSPQTAALVDYFLAKALAQKGYVRAALDRYDALLHRLGSPETEARDNLELAYLISHPELLYTQIGELYEKHGDIAEALKAYELAAARDPDNFHLQADVVRLLPAVGENGQAHKKAIELVAHFRASPESLAILKQVYLHPGGPAAVLRVLGELHHAHPHDRALYFALLDELKHAGQSEQAQRLLAASAREANADPQVLRKLFSLYEEQNDLPGAMRLLVETLANRPDSLLALYPLLNDLLENDRISHARLAALQKLSVEPRAEASRLYWISRMAEVWGRQTLASESLDMAISLQPPFAPAYRLQALRDWARSDWKEVQKVAACEHLAQNAKTGGQASLAAELEGLCLMNQKMPGQAAAAFARAIQLGNKSPDLQLTLADAYIQDGNVRQAEQVLDQILADWPSCEDAYAKLIYLYRDNGEQAAITLRRWLDAEPASVDARLLQATILASSSDSDGVASARSILLDLFEEQPTNASVLAAARDFFAHQHELPQFIGMLEEQRLQHPDNHEIVEMLVAIYADQNRLTEASRVLDATRIALAADPDDLYALASLYERINQKPVTEQVLEQVLKIDPHHVAASNDLGYTWADEGRNLDRAEELVRAAVEAEPDNQSYLDSLGWVEYKRGKFEEARTYLDRALAASKNPDPVVLDHMGDTLYRLSRADEAAKQWNRSLKRVGEIGSERDDLRQLKVELEQKLHQQQQGQPVNVAPVIETPDRSTQAKN